jgi:hypothetical protein
MGSAGGTSSAAGPEAVGAAWLRSTWPTTIRSDFEDPRSPLMRHATIEEVSAELDNGSVTEADLRHDSVSISMATATTAVSASTSIRNRRCWTR